MQVAKWGNSLAIRIPASVVDELNLKAGDHVSIRVAEPRTFEIGLDSSRQGTLERIRRMQFKLPDGWHFDREEANSR